MATARHPGLADGRRIQAVVSLRLCDFRTPTGFKSFSPGLNRARLARDYPG